MTIRFVVQKTVGGRRMPPASGGSRDLGSATLGSATLGSATLGSATLGEAERAAIRNWEPPKFTAAVVPANGIFWGGMGLSDGS